MIKSPCNFANIIIIFRIHELGGIIVIGIVKLFLRIQRYFSAICIIGMSVVVLIGVFFRYVLFYSLPWTEEITKFLLMWMVYFGTGAVAIHGDHLRAELFSNVLPSGVLKIRNILFEIFQAALLGIVVVEALKLVFRIKAFGQVTPVLGIPQWIMIFTFAIGLVLIVLMHFYRAIVFLNDNIRNLDDVLKGEV